ncbi:MAG: magnesium protoporphyrin IX methyltransferase [Gammaproteobacteria bacterium]|nr:magnesium protoporphyrin IX methyltransferase [Gammaproteobacteria bacterium]
MATHSYRQRLAEIEHYFDRTALEAWSRLTSNSPVGRIRSTVRAGRDAMRALLLERLGDDLTGQRILDAGCGTGALSIEAARRGAEVLAIDISPSLIDIARERTPRDLGNGSVEFRVGDMLGADLGDFDHAVAMDSLIHYQTDDVIAALCELAPRCRRSIQFTFAPRTPALAVMHSVGRLFPRGNRAPSIVPVGENHLRLSLEREPRLRDWRHGRSQAIRSGFYQSRACEILRR